MMIDNQTVPSLMIILVREVLFPDPEGAGFESKNTEDIGSTSGLGPSILSQAKTNRLLP